MKFPQFGNRICKSLSNCTFQYTNRQRHQLDIATNEIVDNDVVDHFPAKISNFSNQNNISRLSRDQQVSGKLKSVLDVIKLFGGNQCDQIGRFLKVIWDYFLSKVAQTFGNILGYFWMTLRLSKKYLTSFWATLGKYWLLLFQDLVTLEEI